MSRRHVLIFAAIVPQWPAYAAKLRRAYSILAVVIKTLDKPRSFPPCTNCHWDGKKALCSLNNYLTEREKIDASHRADFLERRRQHRDLIRQMEEVIIEQKRQLQMAQEMRKALSRSVRWTEKLVSDLNKDVDARWQAHKASFEIDSYIGEDQESSDR